MAIDRQEVVLIQRSTVVVEYASELSIISSQQLRSDL